MNALLFEKLAEFGRAKRTTVLGEFIAHVFGFLLTGTTFMFCTVIFALQGKKPRKIDTEQKNVFVMWYIVFQALSEVEDGNYYFAYIVVFECFEITLQMATFDVMVRTNDLTMSSLPWLSYR